jgi:transposase IS481 family protein
VSERTCWKWVARYRAEGKAGLLDRSSAPRSIPHRTSDELVEAIVALRRLRMTGAEIAFCLAIAVATVSAVRARVGLGKLSRLEPPEPPNRYQRRHPGELVHVDVKKLGRIPAAGAGHRVHGQRALQPGRRQDGKRMTGWEFVHVGVDDATRLAYVEVLTDERASTAVPLDRPRLRLPSNRPAPPPHPALPATHQRQGGEIHPHPAHQLGLRRNPRLKPTTHRRP